MPNFKELSIERLIAVFPHSTDEKASLPYHVPLLKLDRNYVLNASLKDHEHAQSGICRATTQNGFGTKKSATWSEENAIEVQNELLPLFKSELFPLGTSRFLSKMKRR